MKKSRTFTIVSIFLILMFAVFTASYNILDYSVKKIIIQNIDELAEHDMQNIREYVIMQYGNMKSIVTELGIHTPETVKELQDELNVEVKTSNFTKMFLIDEENNLYSDTYTFVSSSENDFLDFFSGENGREFVRRYDDDELQSEFLLYGLDFHDDPIELAGVTFTGMAALTDISEIQDKMHIYSFDGRGYSSVINTNGNYIVNANGDSDTEKTPNFFEILSLSELKGSVTVDEVKEKIISRESIYFNCIRENGKKKFISIKPILDSNWFFVYSIDTSVFTEQTYTFTIITIGIIVVLFSIMFITIIILYRMYRKLKNFYISAVEGVYNRRYYSDKIINQRVKALAIIDLDHLKQINDNYGHLAGDQAIYMTASVVKNNIRSFGDVVRYGGDEFIVAFKVKLSFAEFEKCLDNILNDIRTSELDKYPEIKLTTSIGGYYGEGISEELFDRADTLLYQAKKNRNCVVTNKPDEK